MNLQLKALRKQNGETQEDVAKLLKIQRSTVGEYEAGNILPPVDKLKILANHYGVSMDYLIGHTSKENDESVFQILQQLIRILEVKQKDLLPETQEYLLKTLKTAMETARILNR